MGKRHSRPSMQRLALFARGGSAPEATSLPRRTSRFPGVAHIRRQDELRRRGRSMLEAITDAVEEVLAHAGPTS